MKVSISSGCVYKSTIEEFCEMTRDAGFENIEVMLGPNVMRRSKKDIKTIIDDHGLNPVSVHTPPYRHYKSFDIKNRFEGAKLGIEWAEYLNAKVVVLHPAMTWLGNAKGFCKKQKESLARGLVKMKALAPSQLQFGVENLPNKGHLWCCFDSLDEMLQYAKNNYTHLTYDITHHAYDSFDIIDGYDVMKERLVNIHASNNKNKQEHKVLDNGDLDIPQFIRHLKADNYQGLFTVEMNIYHMTYEKAKETFKKTYDIIQNNLV